MLPPEASEFATVTAALALRERLTGPGDRDSGLRDAAATVAVERLVDDPEPGGP